LLILRDDRFSPASKKVIGGGMLVFEYHPDIVERFPNICGGIILARGITNRSTPDDLVGAYLQEQRATIERIGDRPLSEIESLHAWREAYRRFGVDPTKYRSAPEALLRRLTKKGDIPVINSLVDLGNLVSIRYALPIAAFDTRSMKGGITVHFANGSERFTPLFENHVEHPDPGEVVFSDETGLVVARRWCWRQADQSAARLDSRDVIITIEAMHENGIQEVEKALNEVLALMEKYVGGSYTWDLLGAVRRVIVEDK
jgi:DNA/RNA-binding domain of Phe-tRNA-synthetase-like protein